MTLLAAIVLPAVCLGFAFYTDQVWEDFLITVRYSRNLARGNGLVYSLGEHVHGFTSFFNVMIPALFDWLFKSESFYPALWGYRIVCIIALTAGVALTMRLIARIRFDDRWAPLLFLLFMAMEIKTVAFTMNGQEPAFMVLFMAIGLTGVVDGPGRRWVMLGLAAVGLMYTRPDGFIFAGILAAGALMFPSEPRGEVLRGIVRAAVLCILLYAPWLAWVWWYYGSPVPHTIIAKAGAYGGVPMADPGFWLKAWLAASIDSAGLAFEPIYGGRSLGWPRWIQLFSFIATLLVVATAFVRRATRFTRIAGAAFILCAMYLGLLGCLGRVFPWYCTQAYYFAAIALSCGLPDLMREITPRARHAIAAIAIQLAILSCLICLSSMSWQQIAVGQKEIELGVRKPIGLWLRDHIRPGDRVCLEPIGYIGFYSGAKLLDYPGLVSPEVVNARHDSPPEAPARGGFAGVIERLQPEWLVLRPGEADRVMSLPGVSARYRPVQIFSALERLKSYPTLPGRGTLQFDATFVVFKRQEAKP